MLFCRDKAGVVVLESTSPNELAVAASGLLTLGMLAVRLWGRVALARQHRRAMTAVAKAVAAAGGAVRARQRVRGGEWCIELEVRCEADDRRELGSRTEGGRVR